MEEVGSKKRRIDGENELETEDSIDPEVLKGFEEKMRGEGIQRPSSVWNLLFDELVVERLKDRDVSAWMRLMRGRQQERQSREDGDGADNHGASAGVGSVEPDEGRPVRIPTVPYVPTERERREHNATHYPHRTWCECCMAGRAIAGKHERSRDEADPNAGELHFDDCFLKKQ